MELTALRISTVAALLSAGQVPYPTLAGPFVYDSLQGDIVDAVPKKHRPIIVVRTDEDDQSFKTAQRAARVARVLVECSVITAVPGPDGKLLVDWPKTDPVLEATLDALVWQVFVALKGYGPWAEWYQSQGYGQFAGWRTVPRYSSPDRGTVRLAVRTIEFMSMLPQECLPTLVREDSPEAFVDVLPPRLVRILAQLTSVAQGDFLKTVLALKNTVETYGTVPRPAAPALNRVWLSDLTYGTEVDIRIEQAIPIAAKPVTVQLPQLSKPSLSPS